MGLADPGGHHAVLWGICWCVGLGAGVCRAVCSGTKGMAVKGNQSCAGLSEGVRALGVVMCPPCLAQPVSFGSCRLLLPALSLWELQGSVPPLLLQRLQPAV